MPYFDIYVLSDHRDLPTLERYFAYFGNRAVLEQVPEGYEIYPRVGGRNGPELTLPAGSLTEVLRIGVEHPTYGFTYYDWTSHGARADLHGVDVRFTPDGKVVFFVALTDTGPGSYARACQVRDEMLQVTQGRKAFIAYEYPPPHDEAEFDADVLGWQDMWDDEDEL